MMNIFIMILVALFMGTYYLLSSPSLHIREQEIDYSITRADMRSIAECTMALHNANMNQTEFDDVCIKKNDIHSEIFCMDSKMAITECNAIKNKAPEYTYIITYTKPLDNASYNDMMEILEQHYADAGTFGVFMENQIISGGGTKRSIPKSILKDHEFQDGQLVYMTQYSIPTAQTEFLTDTSDTITCPTGMSSVYRFGRWQCIALNAKTNCGGDMIWNYEEKKCVPDESRKPLCAAQQTAVIVDDVWECIDPFAERTCPGNLIPRLNYNNLEWECVEDPNATNTTTKCPHIINDAAAGRQGANLRISASSCTDCEIMVIDETTCRAICIPDPQQIENQMCYPSSNSCSGSGKAFYFGFPNIAYIANVAAVAGKNVPLDAMHSQNRKFNCMDCGTAGINESKSLPPYIVVCN